MKSRRTFAMWLVGALVVGGLFTFDFDAVVHAATCTGARPCNACKNCKYCGHCAKRGGKCGVCLRSRVVPERHADQ